MKNVDKEKLVLSIHSEVVTLFNELTDVVNKFLANEENKVTGKDKLLIVSRAINYQAKAWYNNFHKEFDTEKFIQEIQDARKISEVRANEYTRKP